MKTRKFPHAKIVKLIYLYQQSSCLWDVSSPLFRHKEKRQTALSKIANVFDMSPVELKRKIRSLRATYLMERRKVLASEKKVREGLEQYVYEPVLVWYKYMSFLDDIIVFRTPTAAENRIRQNERTNSSTESKIKESPETRLEEVEKIYYDNIDDSFKQEEVTIPAEDFEANYLCDETMDHLKPSDVLHFYGEDDQQSSNKDDERNLEMDNEELAALKANRIQAETEYFRKKAEYIDICIEKEKKLQPLLIAKLKLEIENLIKDGADRKHVGKSCRTNL